MEYKLKIKATEWKNAPTTTGIYCIIFENSITKRKYIGSAAQTHKKWKSRMGFRSRFKCHLNFLKTNKSNMPKLQNAYNKYGIKSMYFYILEEIEPHLCLQKEQYYIDKYQTVNLGLNSCPTAGSQLGAKRSDKTKSLMKNMRLLDSKKGVDHPNAKPIYQYSICGNFLKKWECISDAQKYYKISLDNLSRNILKGGFCHNFIWSYEDLGLKCQPKEEKRWIGAFDKNNNLIYKFKTRKDALKFFGKKGKAAITKAICSPNLFFEGFTWNFLHYQCPCDRCQEYESHILEKLNLLI